MNLLKESQYRNATEYNNRNRNYFRLRTQYSVALRLRRRGGDRSPKLNLEANIQVVPGVATGTLSLAQSSSASSQEKDLSVRSQNVAKKSSETSARIHHIHFHPDLEQGGLVSSAVAPTLL